MSFPFTFAILDPGHFHAALLFKYHNPAIDPHLYVYGADAEEIARFTAYITQFNQRQDGPTHWKVVPFLGVQFLEKMLEEKKGNVAILAGKNAHKPQYIFECVQAGFNVLADKPMVIDRSGYQVLKKAQKLAGEKGLILYDIMTERFEISNLLQKELVRNPLILGEFVPGSPDRPGVEMTSVHHFFKFVAGKEIRRPAWYFDIRQQGEGIVDVSTHLIDLVQWIYFPGQDISSVQEPNIIDAERWPTVLTQGQFERITGIPTYPIYLEPYLDRLGRLEVFANGAFTYKIQEVYARLKVIWDYHSPTGDTHYSRVRGTKADVVIKQEDTGQPEVYIEAHQTPNQIHEALIDFLPNLTQSHPGVEVSAISPSCFHLYIPQTLRLGHEAHFGKVGEQFMRYVEQGMLPNWEQKGLEFKYGLTTQALAKAHTEPNS